MPLTDSATRSRRHLAGISFPPPLLGMFALIAALSATEAAMGTPAVDAAAAAAAPAVDWIGRWLPLFYVPSLVVLPLALKALPGALVAKARKLGALCVCLRISS